MPDICHIDIETYSETDLKKVGTYRYAECDTTAIEVICFAFDDGPVHGWIPDDNIPYEIIGRSIKAFHKKRGGTFYGQRAVPQAIIDHAAAGGEFRAHSVQFEFTLLNGLPGQKLDFPSTDIEQWNCTLAKCCVLGLPAALEHAANALQLEHRKDKNGYMDMMKLAKPVQSNWQDKYGKRYTYETLPESFVRRYTYCVDDVETERALDNRLPDLTQPERRLWVLDQKINQRGIQLDLEALDAVRRLVKDYKAILARRCKELTGGVGPSKTAVLAQWIRDKGYDIENLQAETIRDILKDKTAPDWVRKVLRIRSLYAMAAVAKYETMRQVVSADGRVRGLFLHHRASTGRWASVKVQLQNLYRGSIQDMDTLIETFRTGDINWLRTLYKENPMILFASGVRGMFIAGPGKDLVAIDYGQVEARCVAWMAGQEDKLEIFRTHGMVYEATGAKIHKRNIAVDDVEGLRAFKKNHPDERFNGKTCLGVNTLVLTKTGWKPILDLSLSDKLWDGVEWISHKGVVSRGEKHLLRGEGVEATIDHEILIREGQWGKWGEVLLNPEVFRSALNLANLSLSDIANTTHQKENHGDGDPLFDANAVMNTRPGRVIYVSSALRNAIPVQEFRDMIKNIGSSNMICLTTDIDVDCLTDSPLQLHDATAQTQQAISTTGLEVSKSVTSGSMIAARFLGMCKHFLTGMCRNTTWTESIITEITNPETFDLSREVAIIETEKPWRISEKKMPVYDVLCAGPRNRFTILSNKGPLIVHNCELACGYQGFAAAVIKMARKFGVDMRSHFATEIASEWREANPEIVHMWYDLESHAVAAVANPNKIYKTNRVMFRYVPDDEFLYMRLPSGRKLAYYRPELSEDGSQVTYLGIDTYTRQWCRVSTYGGRLTQNAAEGICRDLLVNAMFKLEGLGYEVIMHVHDELVMEVDEGQGDLDQVKRVMCQLPEWASDFPIKADGFISKRYRKD